MLGFQHRDKHSNPSLRSLGKAGCAKIYREVASGARSDRLQLHSLLKSLEPGSTLMVTRLDRLARSTIDLLTIIKAIADKGCLFKSLADPWCDTTTPGGRLMLTVLGGLAEFERELIKIRTGEGRERAKRAGVKMGRKPKLSPHQIAEVRSTEKRLANLFVFLLDPYNVSAQTRFRG